MSWRGIDNKVYYMVDTDQYVQLLNYSGCGNTVSGNHPVTKQLIIDSLRQCALLHSPAVQKAHTPVWAHDVRCGLGLRFISQLGSKMYNLSQFNCISHSLYDRSLTP